LEISISLLGPCSRFSNNGKEKEIGHSFVSQSHSSAHSIYGYIFYIIMIKVESTSRTKPPANRWSSILQLFKTNSVKSSNARNDSETSMPWRRRPSAMSDESTLSTSASEDDFNQIVKKFDKFYSDAVEDVSKLLFNKNLNTACTKISS
jgi:hypothetical protein